MYGLGRVFTQTFDEILAKIKVYAKIFSEVRGSKSGIGWVFVGLC